jgi:hypothetical protein
MKINVATSKPYGDYPALTVRAALAHFILPLAPETSITIGDVTGLNGTVIPRQTVQVHVRQITPPGWVLVTRTVPDGLLVRRVS